MDSRVSSLVNNVINRILCWSMQYQRIKYSRQETMGSMCQDVIAASTNCPTASSREPMLVYEVHVVTSAHRTECHKYPEY